MLVAKTDDDGLIGSCQILTASLRSMSKMGCAIELRVHSVPRVTALG
jgi:hypothetical protein